MDSFELKGVDLEPLPLTTSTFRLDIHFIHLRDPHWYMLDSLNHSNRNSRFNTISHWITQNKMPIKNLVFPLIHTRVYMWLGVAPHVSNKQLNCVSLCPGVLCSQLTHLRFPAFSSSGDPQQTPVIRSARFTPSSHTWCRFSRPSWPFPRSLPAQLWSASPTSKLRQKWVKRIGSTINYQTLAYRLLVRCIY
jgi:hypothetical protein